MFAGMRIGVRLGLGFGLVVLLTLVMAVTALSKVVLLDSAWQEYQSVITAKQNAISVSYVALGDGIHHFKNYVIRGGDYDKKFMSDMDGVDAVVTAFLATQKVVPEEERLFADILASSKKYREDMKVLVSLREKNTEIPDLDKAVKGADKPIAAALGHLSEICQQASQVKSGQFAALFASTKQWIFWSGTVICLFAALIAYLTSTRITRPLNEALNVASQLAEGNLAVNIEARSKDETGLLLDAMKHMAEKLSQIIAEIRRSADALSGASEQVSATSQSLSQASCEQAASVENVAVSIGQMSASINQNTENAKDTDSMAGEAVKEAREGWQAVNDTVEAMKQIAGKIDIVDDIAYQTNLLALNAAIEAARVGEQGKGFAVVAAEVRKLAERSQIAAQEIDELAKSSVAMAEKAGKLLNTVLPSIHKTSDLVRDIASASSVQSSGVARINHAMGLINQSTQQNASASEELAATAEEMNSQAELLMNTMEFFKLSDEEVQ